MYYGKIKWYNYLKGFGILIEDITQDEYFIHYSNIKGNSKQFINNARVQFKYDDGKTTSPSKHLKSNIKKIATELEIILNEDNKLNNIQKEQLVNEIKLENTKKIGFDKKELNKNSLKKYHYQEHRKNVSKTFDIKCKRQNTINFKPNYKPTDLRVLYQYGGDNYKNDITERDIIIIDGLFNGYKDIYQNLLKEIQSENIFKKWHGDNHLIADDKINWKLNSPTFQNTIKILESFFKVTIEATRLNYYKDSSDWKPYHHDAAALDELKAKKQNITIGVSFGLQRDISFENAKNGTTISFQLNDSTIYAFGKDVNINWRHGIPQIPKDNFIDKGRISIIIW